MASPNKEDQLRRILYELQMMEGTAQVLQQRMQILTNAQNELRVSQQSLGEMKDLQPGTPILVPVGGAAFIHAKTAPLDKVIVGVGADVSVEMEYPKAVEDVNKRLEEVEKTLTAVDEQLGQVLAQMQSHQDAGNRLSAELQGEGARVR
ncbi:MAG: prefoldin subunit alpha [Candidatus Bathyarchaeota archaeon]|nr:prefoldin subunit alpha [Candidatus Bathyarchaeota archaeon]